MLGVGNRQYPGGAQGDGSAAWVLGVCTLGWASGQYWVLLEALGALRVSTGGTGGSTGALGFGTGRRYLVVLGAWGGWLYWGYWRW